MWYFAYDTLSNWNELRRWYAADYVSTELPQMPRPGLLRNYRLCFPMFSEHWRGGVAGIESAYGKHSWGTLIELPETVLHLLDVHYGRWTDWAGRERGACLRLEVPVQCRDSRQVVRAITHQSIVPEHHHVPPSDRYLDLMIEAACAMGLSDLWIQHLESFRSPRSVYSVSAWRGIGSPIS